MKIISKKDVSYNNSKSSSKTVKMIGEISEIYQSVKKGVIEVGFKYVDIEGEIHSFNKYTITKEEADAIFPVIKDNLPDINVVGYSEYNKAVYLEGFKFKMAEEFPELELADIEIFTEEV